MLKISKGTVINMDEKKSGSSAKGNWCFVPVKAEKGYDSISVFAENAEEASNYTGEAIIKEIVSVSVSSKKNENTGAWNKYYTVSAVIEGKDGNAGVKTKGFEDFMSMDVSDLPFE